MNNYQETANAKIADNNWREMEQRMSERLQIVKNLRLAENTLDKPSHNIQLPTPRLG